MASEKSLQIRHAAIVDIAVGSLEAPDLWISRKVPFHVFMDKFLEIDVERIALGADYDIGPHSNLVGNVASWIGKADIGTVKANGLADLAFGCVDQLFSPIFGRCKWLPCHGHWSFGTCYESLRCQTEMPVVGPSACYSSAASQSRRSCNEATPRVHDTSRSFELGVCLAKVTEFRVQPVPSATLFA